MLWEHIAQIFESTKLCDLTKSIFCIVYTIFECTCFIFDFWLGHCLPCWHICTANLACINLKAIVHTNQPEKVCCLHLPSNKMDFLYIHAGEHKYNCVYACEFLSTPNISFCLRWKYLMENIKGIVIFLHLK